jgi:hypothetical protein
MNITPETDALADALLWVRDEPMDSRLEDISFGRYAQGSGRTGCYWILRFTREIKNGEVQDARQDHPDRFQRVICAWAAAFGVTYSPPP